MKRKPQMTRILALFTLRAKRKVTTDGEDLGIHLARNGDVINSSIRCEPELPSDSDVDGMIIIYLSRNCMWRGFHDNFACLFFASKVPRDIQAAYRDVVEYT